MSEAILYISFQTFLNARSAILFFHGKMGKFLPHVPGVRNELARCAAHQGVSTPPQYACVGCQCRVNEPYCAAISLLLSVIK